MSYANSNTEVIYQSITIVNKEPVGTISVMKTNTNGDKVPGATFKLIAAEDIFNIARTIKHYSKGDTIATITTRKYRNRTKNRNPIR